MANRGTTRVLGIGTVTGSYRYIHATEHAHQLPVRWDDTRERAVERGGWRKALIKLTREEFDEIVALPSLADVAEPVVRPTTEEALDFDSLLSGLSNRRLRFPSELVASYLLALQAKRFVILSGISGTGKTLLAKFIAETFSGRSVAGAGAETAPAGHAITVKPYMLRHNRVWLPVDFLADAPFLVEKASASAPADRHVDVQFGDTTEAGRIWRQTDSNLIGVFWPKTFSALLGQSLSEGDALLLDADEGTRGQPTLHLRVPGDDGQRRAAIRTVTVIAVRPDWTDNRGLLGFYNPLLRSFQPSPFLNLLLAARREADLAVRDRRAPVPFFAVLDEMNLARVEHYFSDFLSCLESGEPLHRKYSPCPLGAA